MMFEHLTTVQQLAVVSLPLLFGITLHEAAHGWVAYQLGDNTAKEEGRLSLNPIRHIDPVGTILLPGAMFVISGFMFGWAKPVPVNPHRLHQPRRDMALVAIAGPGVNLLMALGWGMMLRIGAEMNYEYVVYVGTYGIIINLILMLLNLLPILPLDGGRIVHSVLPAEWARAYSKTEMFGFFILLGLLFTGFLGTILTPALNYGFQLIHALFIW